MFISLLAEPVGKPTAAEQISSAHRKTLLRVQTNKQTNINDL